jgi:hypothetical protein
MLRLLTGIAETLAGDEFQRCIQWWLSPPDSSKIYNIAYGSRHSGTGSWFIQGDTLSEWKESGRGSLLWIHGKRKLSPSGYSFADIEWLILPFHSWRRKERALVR